MTSFPLHFWRMFSLDIEFSVANWQLFPLSTGKTLPPSSGLRGFYCHLTKFCSIRKVSFLSCCFQGFFFFLSLVFRSLIMMFLFEFIWVYPLCGLLTFLNVGLCLSQFWKTFSLISWNKYFCRKDYQK